MRKPPYANALQFPLYLKKTVFKIQETVSAYKDNHLKTQIGKGMELQVPIWHSGTRKAFLIGSRSDQEKGILQSLQGKQQGLCGTTWQDKVSKGPTDHVSRICHRRGWNFQEVQKDQEDAAANDQVAPAQQAKIEAELSSAQEAAAEAKNRAEMAANDMFQLYATPNTPGTKLCRSRPHQTHIQTYKAVLRKDPEDFHTSRLTIA